MIYKDVRGVVGGGFVVFDEFGGMFLNVCYGGSVYDVVVGILVGNDMFLFCVLFLVNDFWLIKGCCFCIFVLFSVVNMVFCV